jgi:hypothetical protein
LLSLNNLFLEDGGTMEDQNNKKEISGINENRLSSLKGNYQKPEISKVVLSEKPVGDCTDMASDILI